MIPLHRLNGSLFYLNHRHIEVIESLPDTVITLTNEKKYIVKESADEIAALVEAYHKKIFKNNFQEAVDI